MLTGCLYTGYVQKCYREGDKVVIVYCAEYNELSSKRKYRKKKRKYRVNIIE